MEFLLRLTSDLIELLTIMFVINTFIDSYQNIKKKFVIISISIYMTISILSFFLYSILPIQLQIIPIVLYIIKFSVALIILYRKIELKIFFVAAMVEFICALLSSWLNSIITFVVKSSNYYIQNISLIVIYFFIIVLMLALKKKIDIHVIIQVFQIIPKHIYILILFAIICLNGFVALFNFKTSNYLAKELALNIMMAILSIVVTSILISLFKNVIAKQYFEVTNSMLEKQIEIQINHYNKTEKLYTEIRSFRHDYTNHLHSILSLITMRQYLDAQEYIEKLLKRKHKNQVEFYTGNKLADAILSDKVEMINDQISINYQGIIPASLDNSDLCIILSNSIDNAIEACNEYNSPCSISIVAQERGGYFVLSIKNPTKTPNSFSIIPQTTKNNKKDHGMGLRNIEYITKKYDGQLKINCENHIFELSVILKVKETIIN